MNNKKVYLKILSFLFITVCFLIGCSDSNPLTSLNMNMYQVSELPEEHNVLAIEFISDDLGWAVGKDGVILHTKNGGKNWITQDSKTTDDLIKIQFLDDQNGWVIASHKVLSTNDAGNTWQSKLTDVWLSSFSSLDFIDKDKGYVSGTADGRIYYTENAGASWTIQQADTLGRVVDISMIDESTGYSLSNVTGISKTTNSGENWTKITTPSFCSSICFLNDTDGFAGNNIMPSSLGNDKAEIFVTKDGGSKWSAQKIPDATAVWKIAFTNSQVGFAISGSICGFTDNSSDWVECGELIYSLDGSDEWNLFEHNLPLTEVVDFDIYDSNKLNVLTKNGEIYFFEIKQ